MAATALIASGSLQANLVNAGEKSLGGLKEWTTDQGIDEESSLDKEAKAAKEKAKEEDICIPIGEGENCW
ncbi:putative Peptidase family M20/M25/M40 [Prochlorococcus sp. MIT 0601]|nr:putative Peptidase family M20/M25/M40 [Prochlorococcus sp. MIT 0601]